MSWVQPVLINLGIALVVGLIVNFGLRALIPYLTRKGYFRRPGSKQARSSAPLLIREAHVIVGDGGVLNDVDILIEQGNITRVESSRIDVPGARVIEARGKTVMPGLIDAHCHLDFLSARNGFSARMQARFGLSEPINELLRFGITSIRTMCEPPKLVLGLRQRTRTGNRVGPTMVVAGPAFTAPGGHPQATVCRDNAWLGRNMVYTPITDTEARTMVRGLKSQGVDLIKIVYQGGHYAEFGEAINKLPENVALAIIDEAHKQGLPVGVHTHYAADVAFLVEAGVDSIEHGVLEEEAPPELLRAWAAKHTVFIPTLSITEFVSNPDKQSYLPQASRNLGRAVEAGVRIAAGTDSMVGAMPADSLHHELQLMVAAGVTPSQAIQAATGNAAEVLRLHDRGLIKTGMAADLVLLNSDPLEGIESVSDIALVVQNGQIVHETEPAAPVALSDYAAPANGIERFTDNTSARFPQAVEVTIDGSTFDSDGVRTITYTDPGSQQVLRTETLRSDKQLRTLEWSCAVPSENTELRAIAHGGRISLSGTLNGRTVSRGYANGGTPWMQGLIFDASTFITSQMESLVLTSIGTSGRGALMAAAFELTKDRQQTQPGETQATLVLPQWRAYWNAKLTSDAETGSLIEYKPMGKGEMRKVS